MNYGNTLFGHPPGTPKGLDVKAQPTPVLYIMKHGPCVSSELPIRELIQGLSTDDIIQ